MPQEETQGENPKKLTRAEEYLGTMRRWAQKVFEGHVISKRSEGRWLLQRPHEDGGWDWMFAAEVIALAGGALYVGGDIDHVTYACGPADPIARVHWMGACTDLDYYVVQKARIGMCRARDTIDEWDYKIAHEELRAHVAENPEELENEEALEEACAQETREMFLNHATKALEGHDAWETVAEMGERLSPAVIYSHAALARLSRLLSEEAEAEAEAEAQKKKKKKKKEG